MSELEELRATKMRWISQYKSYALSLCLAVLQVGLDDDLGDPDSIRQHHMTAKERSKDGVKILATSKGGNFVPADGKYAIIRRLIVTVGEREIVRMVFTDDPSIGEDQYNLFVPGKWFEFANEVLAQAKDYNQQLCDETEQKEITKLREQMMIGIPGFGMKYDRE